MGLNSLQNRIGKWASNNNKRESKIAIKQTITTYVFIEENWPKNRYAVFHFLFWLWQMVRITKLNADSVQLKGSRRRQGLD